ncbi:gamma-mobile-trio recombinase GmtY [Pseudoalteromonas piscicida]|uniref:gamma-mobile-trio recombinase GmtY n=1 Tax=Pseudoalteromonas piscicida TaxID=43662 RepID=UPI0005FA2679|nr:gamma-mobile-trio recombinase GmtY [Pseudoalteromonas piscicida]KJZ02686.1 DNA integration protein [Pseudoalteromonas piscicida]
MDLVRLNAKVYRSNAGVYEEIPVLLTQEGIVESHLSYLLDHVHVRSQSWLDKQVTALKLFIQFLDANSQLALTPKEFFKVFVQQLYSGTIGIDGLDPSMLFWMPRRVTTANAIINSLANYSDWLGENRELEGFLSISNTSSYDDRINWAAWHHKRNRAFLAHTWQLPDKGEIRYRPDYAKQSTTARIEAPKIFPEKYFAQLLFEGFSNYGHRYDSNLGTRLNLRDILITLLLNGAGLRMSEPFHLYIQDVTLDPVIARETGKQVALVRIYHPAEGTAPNDWQVKPNGQAKTREGYLKTKYGLLPRNQSADRTYRAGWKVKKLDNQQEKYIHVQWFPLIFGELFYAFWKLYLRQLRHIPVNHPFAFISLSGPQAGQPLSITAYYQNHQRAVKSIGLTPSKLSGTSPHGHRHAYGQRLKNAGIDPLVRRNALHHSSLESQLVYCEPQFDEVSSMLMEADKRLASAEKTQPVVRNYLAQGFDDVDPQELLSGRGYLVEGGDDE